MPEIIEVELYRKLAEMAARHRPIASVRAPDAWYLKRGVTAAELESTVPGQSIVAARRRGKLLLLDLSYGEPVLGLRFGMSGRLLVDGRAGIDRLWYSSSDVYDRFAVLFADGGSMVMSDPRRLGGVDIDPDLARLGPDALAVTRPELKAALAGSTAPLKARLLDQSRIAGVGNLIADEVLWRAGLSPLQEAGSLGPAALRRLHDSLTGGLAEMVERGGSHTGDLMAHRRPGGRCPRDGTELVHATVGGRSSWWCPRHQKLRAATASVPAAGLRARSGSLPTVGERPSPPR
ncbi:MAG TPA: DNA-formamidopyrimidine glycosylase family protein [Acidimicrobiales bacterium]|nr:DNA-formamidopyrimidine glycosylase family protein [Acidimicrobiales bacterium]